MFQINTDGSGYTVLKSFNGNDGNDPMGELVLSGPTLYGTTSGDSGYPNCGACLVCRDPRFLQP